ncbi:hypothetical protein GW916_03730 [bacterium]|nr:hypothetical protein [bacterium]
MSGAEIVSWPFEFASIEGFAEKPSATKLQVLPDGNFVVASAFARPLLSKFAPTSSALAPTMSDMRLEAKVGPDSLAVVGGLHESEFGDIDLAVIHAGSMSGWMKKLLGKKFNDKTGTDLVQFLDDKGESSAVSTTHMQIKKGKFEIRRDRESGLLWDLWFLGDYVFGLTPSHMWRERYLHMQLEKRETLRNDLLGNFQIHRDEGGSFWSLMENGRLARFEYTEDKAKPTLKRLPGLDKNHGFERSAASKTDGWLYGVSGAGTELFRVRRNAVTFEEEIQNLWTTEAPITALTAVDTEEAPQLLVATEGKDGAGLYSFALIKPEDPELLPDIPPAVAVANVKDVPRVSVLTWDWTSKEKAIVWGAEGYFGSDMDRPSSDKLHIVKIQLI